MKRKYNFWISTRYVNSTVKDEIELQFDDNATEDEIEKVLLAGEVVEEVVNESEIKLVVKHNEMLYTERMRIDDVVNEKKARCYYNLYVSLCTPLEVREFNSAFMWAWLDNLESGYGDANGETIPSNKQVLDKMKEKML